jgi:hypothetical protein
MNISRLIWGIIIVIGVLIIFDTLAESEYSNENMSTVGAVDAVGTGKTSTMRNRMQSRNDELALKCARMFTGYPTYIAKCTTEDGSHLRYAVEIDSTFAIWEQNYIDDVNWRPEVYLALAIGKPEVIICEVVYPPTYQKGCQSISEGMRREAWYQYWMVRKSDSNNWQLSDSHTRLR